MTNPTIYIQLPVDNAPAPIATPVITPPATVTEVVTVDNTLPEKTIKADRYRKGVSPAFPESQPKYLQDELTKLERVLDLTNDELINVTEDGATLKAAIKHEEYLRLTKDAALAYSLDTLKASVDTNYTNLNAAIVAERYARVSNTTALANTLNSLSASVDTTNASLTDEKTVRANADSALSSSLSTLSTTVGGHTTTLTQQAQSIDGLRAKWGVTINANGRISGFSLNSGTNQSSFDIQADTLNVYNPSGARSIYWDGTTLVVRGNIQATSITADAITQTINSVPSNTIGRPVLANPDLIAQGTFPIYQRGGYVSDDGSQYVPYDFTEYIPTGVYVDSSWSVASTRQYLATCTIASGNVFNGGHIGYSETQVVVGDGLGTPSGYANMDNQIYIKFRFNWDFRQDRGGFLATALSWKLVRI
jgi:hypothetical protein